MKFPVGESKKALWVRAPTPPGPHPFRPPPKKKLAKCGLAKFGQIRMAKCGQLSLAKCGIGQIRFGQMRPKKDGQIKFGQIRSRPTFRSHPSGRTCSGFGVVGHGCCGCWDPSSDGPPPLNSPKISFFFFRHFALFVSLVSSRGILVFEGRKTLVHIWARAIV